LLIFEDYAKVDFLFYYDQEMSKGVIIA